MEDDHGQTEEQHEEVPEREPGQDAVPRALQVEVVPHDAHEREVPHDARREQHEREQHDRVRPVGPVGDREQRVQEPRPAAGRRVTRRGGGGPTGPRGGEVPARVVEPPRMPDVVTRCLRVSLPKTPVFGSSGDSFQVTSRRSPVQGEGLLCVPGILHLRPGLRLPGCVDVTELRGPQKEEQEEPERAHCFLFLFCFFTV